jgi:hypothetical protein
MTEKNEMTDQRKVPLPLFVIARNEAERSDEAIAFKDFHCVFTFYLYN